MDNKQINGVILPHYLGKNDNRYVNGYEIEKVEVNPSVSERDFGWR